MVPGGYSYSKPTRWRALPITDGKESAGLTEGRNVLSCMVQIWWKHPQRIESEQSNQVELFLLKTLLWNFNNIKKNYLGMSISILIPNILSVFSASRFHVTSTLFELSAIMSWFHKESYDLNWKLQLNYFVFIFFPPFPSIFPKFAERKIEKIKKTVRNFAETISKFFLVL